MAMNSPEDFMSVQETLEFEVVSALQIGVTHTGFSDGAVAITTTDKYMEVVVSNGVIETIELYTPDETFQEGTMEFLGYRINRNNALEHGAPSVFEANLMYCDINNPLGNKRYYHGTAFDNELAEKIVRQARFGAATPLAGENKESAITELAQKTLGKLAIAWTTANLAIDSIVDRPKVHKFGRHLQGVFETIGGLVPWRLRRNL